MRLVLTGGIGSGKSEVSSLLAGLGAVVVDADAVAREVVAPGTPGLAALVEEFGPEVLAADGSLNRSAMAGIAFRDPDALARLNAITHPLIAQRVDQLLAAAPEQSVVVYDVPLLAEGVRRNTWDMVVVVDAPDEVRIARLVKRGLTEADARARMASQMSREERLALADVVIDNSGSRADLAAAVHELWNTFPH